MAKYAREGTQLLDWIETNREIRKQANQNFMNTDYAFKLYNQAHPDYKLTMPKEPEFSDMSEQTGRASFLPVVAHSRLDTRLFVFFELFLH